MDEMMKQGKVCDKVKSTNNGSMARNLKEMKRLGKEMTEAKTGTQLKEEDNLTPDPLQ